ncbi:hypothetical protein [Lewinella sp. 4G2]|uniref:hypothetical protein n=1 Tax=Lewinella sp. 4G2 TaxID=1803372 RepID=UPI0007E1FB59|nr:hypothetical protein [Lewinella sp. 4G2]OAV45126.1 hypothetical protein A3850_011775 [Lewinella sp. 4G2]
MFWKRKPKCPITEQDRLWIEEKLKWINLNFINLQKQPTFLLNSQYFPVEFDGTYESAEETLNILCDYFQISSHRIKFGIYKDDPNEPRSKIIVNRDGGGSAGLYYQDDNIGNILLEEKELLNPTSMISTLSHELSHYVIMEEKGYYFQESENEILTDLLSIAYGFGLFMGASRFTFSQWQSDDGWGGWSTSTKGYLPSQIIGYALAELQNYKDDFHPNWLSEVSGSFKKDIVKGLKYIEYNRQI